MFGVQNRVAAISCLAYAKESLSSLATPRPENIRIVGYSGRIVGRATMIGGSERVEKKVVVVHEHVGS